MNRDIVLGVGKLESEVNKQVYCNGQTWPRQTAKFTPPSSEAHATHTRLVGRVGHRDMHQSFACTSHSLFHSFTVVTLSGPCYGSESVTQTGIRVTLSGSAVGAWCHRPPGPTLRITQRLASPQCAMRVDQPWPRYSCGHADVPSSHVSLHIVLLLTGECYWGSRASRPVPAAGDATVTGAAGAWSCT